MTDSHEQMALFQFPYDIELDECDVGVIKPIIAYTRKMLSFPQAAPIEIIGLARALHALIRLPQPTKGVDVEYGIGFRLGTADDYDTTSYIIHVSESLIAFETTYQQWNKDVGDDHESQRVFEMEAGGTLDDMTDEDWSNLISWIQGVQSVFDNNAPGELILYVSDNSSDNCMQYASAAANDSQKSVTQARNAEDATGQKI